MTFHYSNQVLKIPNSIPGRPAQYMIRHNQKQYNLCGEFCVAFCMQDEAHSNNIDDFLNYWQATSLKWYQSAFNNGLSRTTGIIDLETMLFDYGVKTPCKRFSDVKLNPPYLVESMLEDYQAIIGVNIDNYGYLVGSGIRHWVVLDEIQVHDDLHSIAGIYNPFTNLFEPYSWREIMTSTGAYKSGIWVPRVQE